jgi:hypothetical protein
MGVSPADALKKEIPFNKEGKPSKVVIAYEQFIEFVEAHGLDLSEEDVKGIHEAKADYRAGNRDAFVGHEEVSREVACSF